MDDRRRTKTKRAGVYTKIRMSLVSRETQRKPRRARWSWKHGRVFCGEVMIAISSGHPFRELNQREEKTSRGQWAMMKLRAAVCMCFFVVVAPENEPKKEEKKTRGMK